MANILVVDDEEIVRETLDDIISEYGHHVAQASSVKSAIALIQESEYDIAIVDLRIDADYDGLEILKTIKEVSSDTEVIMLTGHATVDTAVTAMKLGAYDYLNKPVNIEELEVLISRALEKKELANSVKSLQTQLKEKYGMNNIIGNTPAMQAVFSVIERVSQVKSAVLITGESGTGKELVARAIHVNSPRSNKPFIPVNSAAISNELQESEFFGHAKGAFTGAINKKKGIFEEADGGTVFLDEIADASLSTQAKLLRFLENGEIRRVGENIPLHVDVRLIAATNKDLVKAVEKGTFREDLFYRINVINIHLPPLRERKDDIPILVKYFIQKYTEDKPKSNYEISDSALSLLMKYDWPGNVRELQNVIQHAVAFTRGNVILPDSLPTHIRSSNNSILNKAIESAMPLEELEKVYIQKILDDNSWNCEKAAEILKIGKATIYRKIKEYGLIRHDSGSDS